jgi:hypothetical protein
MWSVLVLEGLAVVFVLVLVHEGQVLVLVLVLRGLVFVNITLISPPRSPFTVPSVPYHSLCTLGNFHVGYCPLIPPLALALRVYIKL